MNRIGYISRKLLTLLFVVVGQLAWGQSNDIYTSSTHCILDQSGPTGGGIGGGTGGGMGGMGQGGQMMAPQGCPRPSFFFDKDTAAVSWVWNMGDINQTTYNTRSVDFIYQTEGQYTVQLTRNLFVNGLPVSQIESVDISVGTYPQQPQFNGSTQADTTVCGGSSLKLNPYQLTSNPAIGDFSYLWYPGGDTTKTIDVDSSGCYSVEVTNNKSGCTRTARINVTFCLQDSPSGGGAEEWYFGQGSTLSFERTEPEVIERDSLASEGDLLGEPETDESTVEVSAMDNAPENLLRSNKATAMVYGPSGALAFYTDGINIYDGDDVLITDELGNSLINADTTASQGLLIVPKSNCNECPHHQYYIIYVDKDSKILSRATIDLRVNGGDGAITEVGVPIAYPITEKINATSNADDTGFVVFSQEDNSNSINITTIDSSGVQSVSQSLGALKEGDSRTGYLAVNSEGNQVAMGVVRNGQNALEVYDYDKEGNVLSLVFTIDLGIAAPPTVYGIEFSENGDFIYVTLQGNPANGESSYLLQVPLLVGDPIAITQGIEIIDESATEVFGAVKLGPVNGNNSKSIFMAIEGATEIPFIQQPDIRGGPLDVGYSRVTSAGVRSGVEVSGSSGLGLPNVIFANQQQSGDGLSATYRGNCFMSTTELEIQAVCSPLRNEVQWNFEDGTSIKGETAAYTFPKLGWNTFSVTVEIYNTSPLKGIINNQVANRLLELTESVCQDTLLVDSIYIKPSPISNLADSAYFCTREVDIYTIDPMASGGDSLTYAWFTAIGTSIGTDSIYLAEAPSTYKLELENEFECFAEDEIELIEGCLPRLFVGEAITPNNDSQNDSFKVEYAHISDFNLSIYNRWGELIFETSDPEEQWDGKVKGVVYSPRLYAYVITYRALDFPEQGVNRVKGSLWVFR